MISIIVPVYNVLPYLDTCVHSILEQTYRDFELILVDDGSTDGSSDRCDKLKHLDSRISVIHKANGGLSDARNCGIKASSGEYLTFIDSDDSIHKQYLQVLYDSLKEANAQVSVVQFRMVAEFEKVGKELDKGERCIYTGREAAKKIIADQDKYMITAWGKLYHRSLFRKVLFPVGLCHEDEFTTYKLLYMSKCVVVTNRKLYYYVQRQGSITSFYSLERLDKLKALREAVIYFKKQGDKEMLLFAQFRYLFNIQIAYYRVFYEIKRPEYILLALKSEFDRCYRKKGFRRNHHLGIQKRAILTLFYWNKRLFCKMVHIYTCLNKKLTD